MPSKRIALFGGSFDPPHRGHAAIARAAADRFGLDRVLFAPAGRQPLKSQAAGASFADRLRMVELATIAMDDGRFLASAVDAPQADGSPNYTVNTLERLRAAEGAARLFALAGADSFHTLGQWREPERLLELAEWIVVSRPGHTLSDPAGMTLTPEQRRHVHLLDNVHEEVAATGLRERLHRGEDCTDLLEPAVASYIRENHLYSTGRG